MDAVFESIQNSELSKNTLIGLLFDCLYLTHSKFNIYELINKSTMVRFDMDSPVAGEIYFTRDGQAVYCVCNENSNEDINDGTLSVRGVILKDYNETLSGDENLERNVEHEVIQSPTSKKFYEGELYYTQSVQAVSNAYSTDGDLDVF